MAELTVEDVVFTLKELGIELNSKLLRRIEWSLGEGNYDRSEERLKEELSDFVLRKSRFRYLVASEISLDDFLCEKGISLAQYRQLIHSLSTPSHYPSLLNTTALESFDSDSSILRFAQHNLELNVILAKLRELGLSHVQCRVILGLGTKSYERLKKQNQELRRDEVSRTGRSENDAWSFAKHVVSELCLGLFKGSSGSPITILETHQGIGDATFLYRYHGNVLGFDNHEETHQLLLDRVQKSGFYRNTRELYLKRFSSTPKDAGPFVFLSEEPTPCEQGLQAAITQGLSFDAVDVDPWTTSQPYFSDVLRVLADQGLVMLTLGDQHPWPKGETLAWERFGIDLYNVVLSEGTKQIWRRNWMFLRRACAWYMSSAAAHSICLLPIVLMRNFEPWAPRGDFPNGVMGIDRVYFLAKRIYDIDMLEQVFQSWTESLPFFGNEMLREEVSGYAEPNGKLNFMSFIDEIWPAMRPFWPRYYEWLITTAEDLPSRWRCEEPSEVSEARNHLRQAIELACRDKVVEGFHLADDWLRNL